MRKLVSILCLVVFSLLITYGFVSAQDMSNRLGIGGRVLYYSPDDDGIEDNVAFGTNLTYIIIPNFSLELDWNYFKADVVDEDRDIDYGDITIMPLMLIGQFRILGEGPIVPYVGAGGGYLFNKIEEEVGKYLEERYGMPFDTNVDIDIDDSWGFVINAGIDWFLTDNLAVNLDTKYLWSETDMKIEGEAETAFFTIVYDGTEEVDLDSWIVGAGVKYYF